MIESYEPDRALWAEFEAMGEAAVTQALIDLTLSNPADWQANLWLTYKSGPIVRINGCPCGFLRDVLTSESRQVRALIMEAAFEASRLFRDIELRVYRDIDQRIADTAAAPELFARWNGMRVADRLQLVRDAVQDGFRSEEKTGSAAEAEAFQAACDWLTPLL